MRVKEILRWLLASLMILAGVMHFADSAAFVRIVPGYLPYPLALVYISGVVEILGGVCLLIPKTRRAAAWGLIALYIAVFPANLHMAIHEIPFGDSQTSPLFLWLRLPLQFLLIGSAWYTRKE